MRTRDRSNVEVILEDIYERKQLFRSSKYKGLKYASIICFISVVALMFFMVFYDRQLSDFIWTLLNGCVILLFAAVCVTQIAYLYLVNRYHHNRKIRKWKERWREDSSGCLDEPDDLDPGKTF